MWGHLCVRAHETAGSCWCSVEISTTQNFGQQSTEAQTHAVYNALTKQAALYWWNVHQHTHTHKCAECAYAPVCSVHLVLVRAARYLAEGQACLRA